MRKRVGCIVTGCLHDHKAKSLCEKHYQQKQRETNPEKYREHCRKWRAAHPEHREKHCARLRKSREANPEKSREQCRKWYSENLEYTSVYNHHRAIFNPKHRNHECYKNMPFFDAWNPDKGGSFEAGADWIIINLGKRPEGHSLHIIHHDVGFVPGNLEWASTKTQNVEQLRYIVGQQRRKIQELEREIMELKKEYTKCEQCNTPNRGGDECRECGADLRVEPKAA